MELILLVLVIVLVLSLAGRISTGPVNNNWLFVILLVILVVYILPVSSGARFYRW